MAELLQVVGAIAAAGAAGAAVLAGRRAIRVVAMLAALALATALIAGQAWHQQLADLRDTPVKLAALAIGTVAGVGLLTALFHRRPILLPLGLLATLPFRIPIDAGGESSNLLVPLYLVIAAGALAYTGAAIFTRSPQTEPEDVTEVPGRARSRPVHWLGVALAASVLVYAAQVAYSSDIPRAVQNVSFFFVPFAVMFVLLRESDWTPRLLRLGVLLIVGEAALFALIGIAQHQITEIFWNAKVMESNEFNSYFRVNSLFWDPNIYGRYLALAAVLALATLLWIEERRTFAAGVLAVATIYVGIVFSSSQTTFAAFLVGAVVLCAVRWSLRRTLAVTGAALAAAALAVSFTGLIEVEDDRTDSLEESTSGRSTLVSEGLDLARDRPLTGYGSGSFAVEFEERNPVPEGEAAVSHTEPVTVAAEQGAIGLATYLAVVVTALIVVFGGLRSIAPGLGGSMPWGIDAGKAARGRAVARIAVAAALGGMLAHTVGYTGFLTDPLSWALLAVGSALASGGRPAATFAVPSEHVHPAAPPPPEQLPPPAEPGQAPPAPVESPPPADPS